MDSRSPPRRQTSPALLGLELDRHGGAPVFRQIAEGLRARIRSGALPAGTRLPPSRELAAQLATARNGVVDAYDELIADGLLEGRGRHGTFVASHAVAPSGDHAATVAAPMLFSRHVQAAAANARSQEEVPHSPMVAGRYAAGTGAAPFDADARLAGTSAKKRPLKAPLDWRPGQAHAHTLPLDAWRAACREAGRTLPPQGYGDPRGDLGLRHAIAGWLSEHRSVQVTTEQIIVTQGTAQALDLIARALLQPGDACATEDPGYAGASLAFRRAGATLRHVPVDTDGMLIDPAFAGDIAPALLHITPTHQYPMGGRLSGPRRRALIDAAATCGALILENEYDCEFNYAGTRYPPIFASAPDRTMLLSTFSKAISPALRLGFIAAPAEAATLIANRVERERLHVSWPVQKIMESLIRSGELERHLRRVRRHYAAMRELIRGRLDRFDSRIELLGDEGGLHVVVRGRTHAIDRALQASLAAEGIRFDTVRDFATSCPDIDGFLLAYGHMDQTMLSASLDTLERCLSRTFS